MQGISKISKKMMGWSAFIMTALLSDGAMAQPTGAALPQQIKIVVPFPPGGSNDIFARVLAQKLAARTGSLVIVDNKPGAGGAIGAEFVMRAAADGATLMLTSSSFATGAAVQKKLPFDPIKGFSPVAMLASGPMIVAVGNDTPYKTTAQLIDAARASKGKLNYGSAGIGSINHLSTELLGSMAKTEMTHIPYKGMGPAVTDLIGGQIQVLVASFPSIMSHIKAGKIRALAVTSTARSKFAPDMPTVSAAVPDYSVTLWWGIFAPPGMAQPLLDRLNSEIRAVTASSEMREVFEKEGADSAAMTAGEFAAFVRSDIEKWRSVARERNIAAD
jgi:tripartite-type tricarboxylate transporter receptor subunit TctC